MSGESTDPRVEPGIGRSLERARKSKGLSLWQVEQETRIRSRYLHDLERENFDVLPAVYVLGSLKTYADFLGLDGAALSRQLKASLVEPAEPDVPEQLATLGETRDEEDEYEAAPVPAVGFDQLFLGMGVILISILAVMTIVAAVAQGDESPVSQINQPSTPESPSEIALAGNVGEDVKRAGDDDPVEDEDKQDKPEAPKDDEAGEEGEDEGEKDEGDASQSASPFGDVEFVPMSPSSSPTTDASASASPTPSSPVAASSTPSSPAPTTAEPDASPTSTAPAPTGASPEPAREAPDAASPAPAPAGGGGVGGGQTAPAGEADSDLISAEADRRVAEAFDEAGIVR
ncbi:MAG: helix-turn-helix domain-containing protein [Actinomycetota bacterium]|nr:helix-turn-helix domain-containing protein [Actinomycetota bacterium]